MKANAKLLAVLVAVFLLAASLSSSTAGEEEDLDRCRAITLDERRPLGNTKFEGEPYGRRHFTYERKHWDVFAGGYGSGKRFWVGFTHDVCHHLGKFRRPLEEPWRVRAFKANFTYRALLKAQKCTREELNWKKLGIQGTGVDVWRNKDDVMFKRDRQWKRDKVLKECGTVDFRFTEGTVRPK